MKQVVLDLQLHSRFSRAVSKEMTLPGLYTWGKKKGIDLLATGDCTHPLWMREIERELEAVGDGTYRLKSIPEEARSLPSQVHPKFLLATEVSCIYSQKGKGRRVHTLIWVPSFESAQKIAKEMTTRGCNLMSDGRPIIGLSSIEVAELVLTIESKALVIPAHCWTPWFSMYGSMSGFDSIEEAFGQYADQIYAVETGLSSNPSMNWQITELDNRAIVSFSDAHSGPKLGREATVVTLPKGKIEISYQDIYDAITAPAFGKLGDTSIAQIAYTIEFYPEEGKYHFSGHRACNIRYSPEDTKDKGEVCPVCGKPLIQGVTQRVEELAGRTEDELKLSVLGCQLSAGGAEISMTKSTAFPQRPGFVMLVPLLEIIAEALETRVQSKKATQLYDKLIHAFGDEFTVLLHTDEKEVAKVAGNNVAVGITKVRTGDIVIDPGYDGVFGVVKLWKTGEEVPLVDDSREQLKLF